MQDLFDNYIFEVILPFINDLLQENHFDLIF